MKILHFRKSVQVGWELQRSLAALGELTALKFDSEDLCGDFTDPEGLAGTVRHVALDVIVNAAAAHAAIDKAESEPDLACTINAVARGVRAREVKTLGAWLVHYSTDYVFDGSGTRPWDKENATGPLSLYGATKLEGKQAIRAPSGHLLIFCTGWVYVARGANFAQIILRFACEPEQLNMIDDRLGALYHLVADRETTGHGYASFVNDFARRVGLDIKIQTNAKASAPTSVFPTLARRPANSRLATDKLQNAFGLTLPYWQTGVVYAH
jgi:dTDP-4-dehydrorhamnose reductase